MTDKNIEYHKIKNDLEKSISNAILLDVDDNQSMIRKKLNKKYSRDDSDSDNDDNLKHSKYAASVNKIISSVKNNKKNNPPNKHTTDNHDNITASSNDDNVSYDDATSEEYEFQKEFTDAVLLYVKSDDKIKDLSNELKKHKQKKQEAETEIIKHLERLGETKINITGGILRKNQSETKASIKPELIKEAINAKIKDEKTVEEILEKLDQNRETKVRVSIKRSTDKK
jgi:hypothetical protein